MNRKCKYKFCTIIYAYYLVIVHSRALENQDTILKYERLALQSSNLFFCCKIGTFICINIESFLELNFTELNLNEFKSKDQTHLT